MPSDQRIEYLNTTATSANTQVHLKRPSGVFFIRLFFSVAAVVAPVWVKNKALQLFLKPRVRAKHTVSDDLLNTVIRHDLNYEDKLIRVYEWKGGDRKAVMLHGWESRATALRIVVPYLNKLGYTVYGIDAPAHGESGGKTTNVKEYAQVLASANNIFGPFDLAITHSFGALAASYANVEIPGFHIPKLIMLAQPATTKLALHGMYRLLKLNDKIKPGIEKVIHDVSGYAVRDLSVAHLSKYFKEVNGLLFHDENDNLVPLSVAIEVAENWQSSHLYITKGLGHYRLIKSKEVINKIVEWLSAQV